MEENTGYDNLTLEQKFSQINFEKTVQNLSNSELKELLIYLHKMMTMKENAYKHMIKDSWFGNLPNY